jgi:hypothetical protein
MKSNKGFSCGNPIQDGRSAAEAICHPRNLCFSVIAKNEVSIKKSLISRSEKASNVIKLFIQDHRLKASPSCHTETECFKKKAFVSRSSK